MRLFISIPLDDDLTGSVTDIQNLFRMQNVRGNYTPKENLHITLAFIGEYPDPEKVMDALRQIRFAPFNITMDHVGCFGDLWWAGLAESSALQTLARSLRRALSKADIPFDRKRFQPHVTFLRRAESRGAEIRSPKQIEPAHMTVNGISLMLSTRGKSGMIYSELGYIAAD